MSAECVKKTSLWNGLPILDLYRQLGRETEIKFMEALDIQKNATQFEDSSTPKLTQGHVYFLGNYLGKLLPKGSMKTWHLFSPGQAGEPLWTSESSIIGERKTEAYLWHWGLRWSNECTELRESSTVPGTRRELDKCQLLVLPSSGPRGTLGIQFSKKELYYFLSPNLPN